MEAVADNRNIIRIDKLDDNELKEYLNKFRGRIPSVLLDDLYNKLKGKNVTKEQVDKIVRNIEENLTNARKIDDIFKKLENIESLLRQRVKEQSKSKVEATPSYDVQRSQETQKSETFDQILEQSSQPIELEIVPSSSEPRLKQIPNDAKGIMILLKWIEFMIERVGYDGLEDLLNYYVDINWISDNVLFTVLRYAKGIKLYHESSDWRPIGYMNVQDHITSLLFIEALRTGRFNRELVLEVEREIYKIKKEVAEIHGI